MDIMEKLVELLNNSFAEQYEKRGFLTVPHTATDLIAHGVTLKDVPDTNVGEWISVDEELPKKDGRYLVAMKDGDNYHISTRRFKIADPPIWWKGIRWGHWAKRTCGVRYWAPLPEPPKGE